MIIVPVGGGGLIAGIAAAAKAIKPGVRIIGAQAAACPSAYEAIGAGSPVRVTARPTIADGIRVAESGARTFPVLQELVEGVVLASEDEIADAMLLLLERKHVVAEGAGAAPLAVLLNGSITIPPGSTVVLVISGGNIDSAQLLPDRPAGHGTAGKDPAVFRAARRPARGACRTPFLNRDAGWQHPPHRPHAGRRGCPGHDGAGGDRARDAGKGSRGGRAAGNKKYR